VYVLIIAKDQLIPVVLALLVFFIILMIATGIRHLPGIGKNMNRWVSIFLAFLSLAAFFYLFGEFL